MPGLSHGKAPPQGRSLSGRCRDGFALPLKSELPTTTTPFAGAGRASFFRTQSFEIESIDGCKFILERRRFQELADSQFILPIGDRLFPALFPAR